MLKKNKRVKYKQPMSMAGKSGSCIRLKSCGQDTFGMRIDVYAQSASQVLLSEVVDVPDKKHKLVHTNTNSYI